MAANLARRSGRRKRRHFDGCRSKSISSRSMSALGIQNAARPVMSAIERLQPEPRSSQTSGLARTFATFGAAMAWLRTAIRRRRGRKQLAQLDEHLLRDIGLTRHDARRGTGKRR
jgi:uncharacterized protein YjiS (DUF1127 family)